MRQTVLGLAGTLTLAAIAVGSGCSSNDPGPNTGTAGSGGATGGTGQGGTGTGQAGTGTGTGGSGGGGGGPISCDSFAACGGDVVGVWKVTSSCLKLSGNLDTSLLSLGCPSVPVNGSLQTTGTFTANADGTYNDNTTTTGNATFPLDATCLSVSSVAVGCDRIGNIFKAAGWDTAQCTPKDSGCDCALTANQQGGMGTIVPFTEPAGPYTTSSSTLTASNVTYSYCAQGDKLTVLPQSSALSGSIVLTREGGGGGMGGGGAGGQGGTAGGGQGGTAGQGGSGGSGGSPPVGTRPCDIYEAASNECVAAHSTIRALYAAYNGPLYQVRRADGMMKDIPVKTTGGYADSAQQESFCMGTTCTIWRVYDQSGHGNFLEAETPTSTVGGAQGQTAANAAAEALTVGGNKVYSLFTRPYQAYWRDGSKSGMPLGADPQGIYMVTSGTHFNDGCCYNYGNAQLSRIYEGGPTMDAIYFGNNTIWGTGAGNGPWIMADMEDGMLSGPNSQNNPNLPSMPYKYVTAVEKNNGTSEYALRGADATTGTALTTFYQGALPQSKRPMRKQGAIVLGSGGDCCLKNNNLSEGTFYEGAIVTGYPANATEDAIQANIREAGYGK